MGPHGRRLAEEVDQDEDRHAGEVLPLAGLLVPPHSVPAAHDVLPHTVTGKLEIKANSEARRLPDCGPGRDEGVDAVILGGGKDGDWQRRTHSSTPGQNADLVLVRVSGATHAVLALNLARSLRLSWSQSSEKISSLAQSRNSGSSGNVSVTI